MERTLWHLGLRNDRIFVGAFTPWICYTPANVLLGHDSSFVFYFLFVVLGCWVVGHEKREIPFLSEWSFCFVFRETVSSRPASNPEFLICFADWRIGERRFPFLSKLGAIRYYCSCFLFCFLQLSLLL
jgi:hypothetical protein